MLLKSDVIHLFVLFSVTVAMLAKKNTVMSPEVLLKADVPCCR